MEGIGRGLVTMFWFILVVGVIGGGLVIGSIWFFTASDSIESREPLKPEIKLVVEDNVVDTVYVYKAP